MDDQGKRATDRSTGYVQFHWNVRLYRHGFSRAGPIRACGSLQALLSREHIPALGARVCVYSRTVARPHDRVRENGTIALGYWKLQRSDDGDRFASTRSAVARPKFRKPHASVFLRNDSGGAPGRFGSLSAFERVEMPVDGRLTELESLGRADVEAAKLRPLLAWRYVHASHFGQVLVSSRVGRLGRPFHVARPKYAVTAHLNDDRTLSRREKMWHIRRNDYEAASGIGLQRCFVEPVPNPQVPRTFDHGEHLVIWMRVGEDARATGDSHPVDPVSTLGRIADEVGALPPVGVRGRRDPSNVLRHPRGDRLPWRSGRAGRSAESQTHHDHHG